MSSPTLQLTKIEFPFRIQFAQSAFPELKFEAGRSRAESFFPPKSVPLWSNLLPITISIQLINFLREAASTFYLHFVSRCRCSEGVWPPTEVVQFFAPMASSFPSSHMHLIHFAWRQIGINCDILSVCHVIWSDDLWSSGTITVTMETSQCFHSRVAGNSPWRHIKPKSHKITMKLKDASKKRSVNNLQLTKALVSNYVGFLMHVHRLKRAVDPSAGNNSNEYTSMFTKKVHDN